MVLSGELSADNPSTEPALPPADAGTTFGASSSAAAHTLAVTSSLAAAAASSSRRPLGTLRATAINPVDAYEPLPTPDARAMFGGSDRREVVSSAATEQRTGLSSLQMYAVVNADAHGSPADEPSMLAVEESMLPDARNSTGS